MRSSSYTAGVVRGASHTGTGSALDRLPCRRSMTGPSTRGLSETVADSRGAGRVGDVMRLVVRFDSANNPHHSLARHHHRRSHPKHCNFPTSPSTTSPRRPRLEAIAGQRIAASASGVTRPAERHRVGSDPCRFHARKHRARGGQEQHAAHDLRRNSHSYCHSRGQTGNHSRREPSIERRDQPRGNEPVSIQEVPVPDGPWCRREGATLRRVALTSFWLAGWEDECCGPPRKVGDTIAVDVAEQAGRDVGATSPVRGRSADSQTSGTDRVDLLAPTSVRAQGFKMAVERLRTRCRDVRHDRPADR